MSVPLGADWELSTAVGRKAPVLRDLTSGGTYGPWDEVTVRSNWGAMPAREAVQRMTSCKEWAGEDLELILLFLGEKARPLHRYRGAQESDVRRFYGLRKEERPGVPTHEARDEWCGFMRTNDPYCHLGWDEFESRRERSFWLHTTQGWTAERIAKQMCDAPYAALDFVERLLVAAPVPPLQALAEGEAPCTLAELLGEEVFEREIRRDWSGQPGTEGYEERINRRAPRKKKRDRVTSNRGEEADTIAIGWERLGKDGPLAQCEAQGRLVYNIEADYIADLRNEKDALRLAFIAAATIAHERTHVRPSAAGSSCNFGSVYKDLVMRADMGELSPELTDSTELSHVAAATIAHDTADCRASSAGSERAFGTVYRDMVGRLSRRGK